MGEDEDNNVEYANGEEVVQAPTPQEPTPITVPAEKEGD